MDECAKIICKLLRCPRTTAAELVKHRRVWLVMAFPVRRDEDWRWVEPVGAAGGFGAAKGDVIRLAHGYARELGKIGEPPADGGGTGGDAKEHQAKPPVWRRGVAAGNRGQVGPEQPFPRPLAARSDEGKWCMNHGSAHAPVVYFAARFFCNLIETSSSNKAEWAINRRASHRGCTPRIPLLASK